MIGKPVNYFFVIVCRVHKVSKVIVELLARKEYLAMMGSQERLDSEASLEEKYTNALFISLCV